MTTEAKADPEPSAAAEHPLAHLVATPEERATFLAGLAPFDTEAWMRTVTPPTPEELVDLEDFLQEREDLRRQSLAREVERLAGRKPHP
jgi:hypothetical protein